MNTHNLRVYYLCTKGKGLTPEVSDTLFREAQAMFRSKRRRVRIKKDGIKGIMRTEFRFTMLNSHVHGIEFFAEVEFDETPLMTASFIIRQTDLEVEELMSGIVPEDHPLLKPMAARLN